MPQGLWTLWKKPAAIQATLSGIFQTTCIKDSKSKTDYSVVMHTFNPSTWKAEAQADLCEFKARLVYKESSRTNRAVTQRNPVSETKRQKKINDKKQNTMAMLTIIKKSNSLEARWSMKGGSSGTTGTQPRHLPLLTPIEIFVKI